MHTATAFVRTTPVPDPKLVKKVRRTAADFLCLEPLPGEWDHDYLPLVGPAFGTFRPQQLGRPTW